MVARKHYRVRPILLKTSTHHRSPQTRPLIGGVLSRPHDHWPETFTDPFWLKYPYFLPCAVVATVAATIFVVTATVLKEVHNMHLPSFYLH